MIVRDLEQVIESWFLDLKVVFLSLLELILLVSSLFKGCSRSFNKAQVYYLEVLHLAKLIFILPHLRYLKPSKLIIMPQSLLMNDLTKPEVFSLRFVEYDH